MKKFISIVICLVLFGLISISFFIMAFNKVTTVSFVNDVVDKTDVSEVLDSLAESGDSEIQGALDDLYQKAEKEGFSKEQVDEVLDSDMTKALIERYAEDFLVNDEITEDDINEIVENSVDSIIEQSDGKLQESDRGKIIEAGKTVAPSVIESMPTKQEITNKLGIDSDIDFSKKDNSKLFIIIGAIVILMAILIVLQRKKAKWLIYSGVTILCVSITIILLAFLMQGMVNLMMSDTNVMANVPTLIVGDIKQMLINYSLVGLGIFVLEIIVYYIFKNKRKKLSD